MSYLEIYKKRLNRYGLDFQSRVQGQREREFELYLLKSVYRTDIEYDGASIPVTFEKYRQDDTRTLHYLLTQTSVQIPAGTVLMIADAGTESCIVDEGAAPGALIEGCTPWMVYYLEHIKASGYNRYIMLRMSHYLSWVDRSKTTRKSWAYLFGQKNNMLKDEIRSRSRSDTVYGENMKLNFFIMPRNEHLKKDDYFIVGEDPFQEYYHVTGYDIQSTEGVAYVSIDPIYEFDLSTPPTREEGDDKEDFFWLEGGN